MPRRAKARQGAPGRTRALCRNAALDTFKYPRIRGIEACASAFSYCMTMFGAARLSPLLVIFSQIRDAMS
jgi:hypothetical protein